MKLFNVHFLVLDTSFFYILICPAYSRYCLSEVLSCMSVVVNVMLSLMSVMSPPPVLCNLSVRTAVKLCIFLCFGFRGELGFLNCE